MFTGPHIVTDDLVVCLDAANTKSHPGSGTTWYDLSGRNNDATMYNGPVLSEGALVLDGTGDYIVAPSCNTLGGLANQAFELWVKTPGLGSGQSIGGLICPDYGQISYIDPYGNIVYYAYLSLIHI